MYVPVKFLAGHELPFLLSFFMWKWTYHFLLRNRVEATDDKGSHRRQRPVTGGWSEQATVIGHNAMFAGARRAVVEQGIPTNARAGAAFG